VDNPFLRSLFVQPSTVLGKTLKPFSAYHAAALMLLDSAFVTGQTPGISDLALACLICSEDSVTGPATLFPQPDQAALEDWGGSQDWDYDYEIEKFLVHMADYTAVPDVWIPEEQSDTADSGIPWPFFTVSTVLMHMHGITRREAWDMPLSELVSYKRKVEESHGWQVVEDKIDKMVADVEQAIKDHDGESENTQ
jgi:hypothetical protein